MVKRFTYMAAFWAGIAVPWKWHMIAVMPLQHISQGRVWFGVRRV